MARTPDPRQELARLEQALAAGLAAGYVLRHEERWFAEEALARIKAAAARAELELCLHDGGEPGFEPAALLDDLVGTAMFASARCVVLRSPEELLKKTGGEESPATRAIRSFLEGRRGTLVLVATGLRADHAAVKAVEKAGGASFQFRALYDSPAPWAPDPRKVELVEWIGARARAHGARLSVEQALLLAKAKGNDLVALDGELAQHAACGPRAESGLAADAAGSPWRLAEHLLSGDVPRALFEIEQLWRSGFDKSKGAGRETATGAILAVLSAGLRRGVRQGLTASAALAAGSDPGAAATAAGVPAWPKAREPFLARLGSRAPADWLRMQRDLLELERRSRLGSEVDANDLAALALRWRVAPRAAGRAGRARR